jgi:cell wall-associated NlpC family hydrolase
VAYSLSNQLSQWMNPEEEQKKKLSLSWSNPMTAKEPQTGVQRYQPRDTVEQQSTDILGTLKNTTQKREEMRRSEFTAQQNLPNMAPNVGSVVGPVSSAGMAAANIGSQYIGKSKYVWGGGRTDADVAAGRFDCSGFVNYAFRQMGVDLGGGNTDTIAKRGVRVNPSSMQPGDIVFFDTYKKNGHVGIYLGNGKFIGSQSKGVGIADMSNGYFAKTFKGYVVRV